jgi:hypothetical protein
MEFVDASDAPAVSADSSRSDAGTDLILDGAADTAWHSAACGEQQVAVVFPQAVSLGGLEIYWGKDYAESYVVEVKNSDAVWQSVYSKDCGNGGRDYIFFSAVSVREMRIRCLKSGTGAGYSLSGINFKGGDEQATPLRHYLALARDSRLGIFPMWMNSLQEFWTITGVPDDSQESLLGETGTFEPFKDSFSVMPFVLDGGRLVTSEDVNREQTLEEDSLPLPGVSWDYGTWTLDISAVSFGSAGESLTAVRYRFHNRAPKPFKGSLALAVRPVQLNPIWQYGGMSPMHRVSCSESRQGALLDVDGKPRMAVMAKPDSMAALPYSRGDIIDYIAKGKLPKSLSAEDTEGRTSAGFVFDLNVREGEYQDVIAVFPLHTASVISPEWNSPSVYYAEVWNAQKAYWHELLNRFVITVPEQRLIDVLKSNLAYILLNQDGAWIKPGSRNYDRSWIRDGAMTCVALLRMGIHKPVENFLKSYIPLVDSQGWVPWVVIDGKPLDFITDSREGHEYDSQGQFLFLLRRYLDFTGDSSVLAEGYPAAVRALKFGSRLRQERMTDEYRGDKAAYYGILPESNSHEGYYPAMHSYWDDFWYIGGLKDGLFLAKSQNKTEDAEWIEQEKKAFRKDLYKSIMNVIKRDNLSTIPGCVEKGDFDATSTAIAVMACGETEYLPQPYFKETFDRYYDDFLLGLRPGCARSFTPYEVRTADAFIRMNMRERALTMFREFSTDSTRPYGWNHMAEVVHGRYRTPSYIGDMPHTWGGSGYVSAVRTIFAYEYEDTLVIAAGIPEEWLREGVIIKDLPTQFGLISYSSRMEKEQIVIEVSGAANPPGGIILNLPAGLKGTAVFENGDTADLHSGGVTLKSLPALITVER